MSSKHKKSKDSIETLNITPPPNRQDSRSKDVTNPGSSTKLHKPSAHSTPKSSRRSSKVTINSSLTEDINKDASTIYADLPSVPSKPEKYKPIPYTFRILSKSTALASRNDKVKCPPFYVQLDHTLAVVWSLFSEKPLKKLLGAAQLQWALTFLKGVRNKKGKHPKDVAVCIEAMEEALIQHYAAMADAVKPINTHCKCLGGKPRRSKSSSLSTVNRPSITFDSHVDKPSSKNESQVVTEKLPFSVTYAEMAKHRPNRVEQLFKAKDGVSMTGADIQRQLDNLKSVVSSANSEIALDPSYSRENMVDFLKVWRKEQINRLQEELQRLHSIETFIGTLDRDNFKPYLNNQQVDVLVAQKVKKGEDSRSTHPSLTSVSSKSNRGRSKTRTK